MESWRVSMIPIIGDSSGGNGSGKGWDVVENYHFSIRPSSF